MGLSRKCNVECNYNEEGPPIDGIAPGWCRQGPVDDVFMWFDKATFNFENRSNTPKLATVRRTLEPDGLIQEYQFRVDNRGGRVYSILWCAEQDQGILDLVSVIESPMDGGLEAFDQMEYVNDAPYPRIINHSPHWVYVSAYARDNGGGEPRELRKETAPPSAIERSGTRGPVCQNSGRSAATDQTSLSSYFSVHARKARDFCQRNDLVATRTRVYRSQKCPRFLTPPRCPALRARARWSTHIEYF
ncbi:hypothetical protein OKW26_000470 [Paraburkholderia sp. 32]